MEKASLLKIKCECCGGQEFIEDKQNVFKCVFCGTSYYLDKPTTKNRIKVINNTYNVYGNHDNSDQTSIDHLIKSANYFLIKLKNYDKAKELFERITIEAPHDYRGWWGLICAENYNLNSRLAFENEHDPHEYEEESENFRSITIAAPKTIAQKLLETWDNYLQGYDDLVADEMQEELQSELEDIDKQISESQETIKKSTYDYSVFCVKAASFCAAAIAILMILSDNGNGWNLLLLALVCIFVDFVFYANLFDVVELVCSDLHETLEKERSKLTELSKQRSKLLDRMKEI